MQDAIGPAIGRAREGRGWSQSELARRLGVGQPTVNGWERGRRVPDLAMVRRLEALLGVSFNADGPDAATAFRLGYAASEFDQIVELSETIARRARAAAARMRGEETTPSDAAGALSDRGRAALKVAETAAVPYAPRRAKGR